MAANRHVDSVVDILMQHGQVPTGWSEDRTHASFHCPFNDHADRTPSFSVNIVKNLWNCFGCGRGGNAADLVAQLNEESRTAGTDPCAQHEHTDNHQIVPPSSGHQIASGLGCTLEQVAAEKGIPTEFLREVGWSAIPWHTEGPAVKILYRDETGQEAAYRFRIALTGDRFRWRSGSKPMPYGLWRLSEARERGFVYLVEGETDTVTLWYHDLPALGIPGAGSWQPSWSRFLDGIEVVYAVAEPDQGGTTFLSRLGRSPLRERVKVVHMTSAIKDVSDLHRLDPEGFLAQVEDLQSSATGLTEEMPDLHKQQKETSERAWPRCASLATQPDILAEFVRAAERQGVVGESRALKTLYLVMTSRLLEKPVSAVVKAPSGAGKSLLEDHVCSHFPSDSYVFLTTASPKALLYADEPLCHRAVIFAEASGVAEGFGAYLLRSLVSEGRLKHLTVNSTDEGLTPHSLEVEGPIALLLTTTRANLDEELETRLLSVPVDDSPEQTKQVMLAAARRRSRPRTDDTDLHAVWHDLQVWLTGAHHVVEIPFAEAIVELTPPRTVAMRRGINMLLSLIESRALLHQATRDRSASGNILATYEDYAEVRELVGELIARRNASVVSRQVREVVKAVARLTRLRVSSDDREGVSIQSVAAHLGLDQASVKLHVSAALALGYLRNVARSHQTRQLRVGDPIPDDITLFPTVEEVRARASSGVTSPLPRVRIYPDDDGVDEAPEKHGHESESYASNTGWNDAGVPQPERDHEYEEYLYMKAHPELIISSWDERRLFCLECKYETAGHKRYTAQ